ncbi:MAG: hypothetical protein WBO46_27275 [Caldilineaceae bacterium]
MDIKISVDDTAPRQMLNRAPANVKRASRAAMNDSTALLLRDLRTYPAPPANSTYTRTRTLSNSWSREFSDFRGFVGSNGRIAPYNRFVQDADKQARIHRGRWTNTVQGVAQRRKGAIVKFFRERTRQYVGK